MKNTKPIAKSTTIQSSIVVLIVAILSLLKALGINIDLDEGYITELVASIFLIGGGIGAVIGRLKATRRLTN